MHHWQLKVLVSWNGDCVNGARVEEVYSNYTNNIDFEPLDEIVKYFSMTFDCCSY